MSDQYIPELGLNESDIRADIDKTKAQTIERLNKLAACIEECCTDTCNSAVPIALVAMMMIGSMRTIKSVRIGTRQALDDMATRETHRGLLFSALDSHKSLCKFEEHLNHAFIEILPKCLGESSYGSQIVAEAISEVIKTRNWIEGK